MSLPSKICLCNVGDNDIATNYGPKFYRYHKMFSAKAANAIIEHNIAINWGKVDDRLLHLVMHGTQSRECELCGDNDHTTKFCAKLSTLI
jgi:hypothetical protein